MRTAFLLNRGLFASNTCAFKTIAAFFLFIFLTTPGICWSEELYEYDEYNRLRRVDDASVTMEFEYDGAGNRIAIRSNTSDAASDRSPSYKKSLAEAKIAKHDTKNESTFSHVKLVNNTVVR